LTEFSQDAEYVFQEPARALPRLGRPSLIDDASLHNRRERFVQIFEGCWGEIGWALHKCRKPDDLVSIFSVLSGRVWDDAISVFRTAANQPGTRAALTKIRLELRGLVKPIYVADQANRNAQERLDRARWALGQATKRRDRKPVRKELVKRRKEAQQVTEEYRKLSERERGLLAQLKLSEASFARREVFQFLKSKRYELNPVNLANAAAGLPFMGWRQSMRRCSKERCISANGLYYQVFKSIRYLTLSSSRKTKEVLIEHFRKNIPLLPRRYGLAKTELMEKWFFLDRAIRITCRVKPHTKSLAFEITKNYLKQMQTQSHIDILLAERAKLSLSG